MPARKEAPLPLKIKIGYFACLFLLIQPLTAQTCLSGGWTLPEGELYSRFAFNYYRADESYDSDGNRRNFPNHGEFKDLNESLYIEYGYTPYLSVIANMVYKYLRYEDDSMVSKTYGVADIELAARYCIWKKNGSSLSSQGLLKIPEAYNENKPVPLGNGQYDFEIRLLFGQSLHPLIPGYLNLEAGYRFRLEEPADEFRYLVEAGSDITQNLYVRVKLDGIMGIGNDDPMTDRLGNPTTTLDFDLGKLDICFGYKITDHWGVEGAWTPSLFGKNTASGATWTIAFVYKTY